jgi:hypothetical protein
MKKLTTDELIQILIKEEVPTESIEKLKNDNPNPDNLYDELVELLLEYIDEDEAEQKYPQI